MIELRFLDLPRGGLCLQYRYEAQDGESTYMTEWKDVPTVKYEDTI